MKMIADPIVGKKYYLSNGTLNHKLKYGKAVPCTITYVLQNELASWILVKVKWHACYDMECTLTLYRYADGIWAPKDSAGRFVDNSPVLSETIENATTLGGLT